MAYRELIESADRSLYEHARERDRQLWVTNAVREWRDALRAGIDDGPALAKVALRRAACARGRMDDRIAEDVRKRLRPSYNDSDVKRTP